MKKKAANSIAPIADDDKWRAESDLRTLRDAEEIRMDKARVARAQSVARDQMKALSKVAGPEKPSKPRSSNPSLAKRLEKRRI